MSQKWYSLTATAVTASPFQSFSVWCYLTARQTTYADINLWRHLVVKIKRVCVSCSRVVLSSTDKHSGVTGVGVTRGGKWRCHPYFFWKKNWRSILVIAVCSVLQCRPYFFSKILTTFFAHHCHFFLISLGCHPLQGVTRTFFTCPTSFVHYSL